MNTANQIEFFDRAVEQQEEILDLLTKVIDPELGIDIVNLGLIYEVHLNEAGRCFVKMTLTTMGCPLVDYIVGDIRYAMEHVTGVQEVDVELTFDPPWDLTRLSRYARIALGIPSKN